MRLIDADALKENFPLPFELWEMKGQQTLWPAREIRETIDLMPTIEERKKGKWILVHDADETGNALYECPVCHKGEVHVPIVEVNYCWNCGADMRGDTDD